MESRFGYKTAVVRVPFFMKEVVAQFCEAIVSGDKGASKITGLKMLTSGKRKYVAVEDLVRMYYLVPRQDIDDCMRNTVRNIKAKEEN